MPTIRIKKNVASQTGNRSKRDWGWIWNQSNVTGKKLAVSLLYVCTYTLTTLEISVVSSIEVGSITAVDTTGSISVHTRNNK